MTFWKKLHKSEHIGHSTPSQTEQFLQEREDYCVSAISRFNAGILSTIWAARSNNTVNGLLLYGKRMLFPVFCFSDTLSEKFFKAGMPLPFLFPAVLKNDKLHAAQGLTQDMDLLERSLCKKGLSPKTRFEYELRSLSITNDNYSNSNDILWSKKLTDLVIRRAEISDIDAILPLQAGYESEEVLPPGAQFNPAHSRMVLEQLVGSQVVLVAELDGCIVGKININDRSYTRLQIGGVYVIPELRGLGIAQIMTAAIISEFTPVKNRFTLFVKKTNTAARRVYDKLDFIKIGNYRISYF